MNPVSGDVICLSGYSFCRKDNTRSLVGFARICQGEAFPVLFDVGPMVADIELDVLQTVNGLHPIWSLNECEGPILAGRLGRQPDVRDETGLKCICRSLSLELHNPVVLRAGALGASCCQTRDAGLSQYIPPPLRVHARDTNGAGDAHSGVLCPGALSATQPSPATCPDEKAIRKAPARLQG